MPSDAQAPLDRAQSDKTLGPNRPKILLVEDDALIGLMLEDDLRDSGFAVLGPFTSCAATLAWLHGQKPDAAVLDIILTDGPCVELARVLRERDVPFVVFTGQSPASEMADDFAAAPWIAKPASSSEIVETLRDMLGRSGLSQRQPIFRPCPYSA
jgi:DNA-binding response OmpR family regulator